MLGDVDGSLQLRYRLETDLTRPSMQHFQFYRLASVLLHFIYVHVVDG